MPYIKPTTQPTNINTVVKEEPPHLVIWKYSSYTLFMKEVEAFVMWERQTNEGRRIQPVILTHKFFSWP